MPANAAPAPIRSLSPLNPLDHLRLLWWFFMRPSRIEAYRTLSGAESLAKTGAWLSSTLLWIPLLIIMAAIGAGTLPRATREIPLWLALAGIVLGWALTGLLAEREDNLSAGWHAAFGEVFSTAFVLAFGVAFGVAFGFGLISGLDIGKVVIFKQQFSPAGILMLVAAFSIAYGLAYVIADGISFGGLFIFAPVLAFMAAFVGILGIQFVGVFFSIFLTLFGFAFVGSFITTMLAASTVVRLIERTPGSWLEILFRVGGFFLIISAYLFLIWLCLLRGWRLV
jgi:hypothetical protein